MNLILKMKRMFFLTGALALTAFSGLYAQDFSATTPTGRTVEVTAVTPNAIKVLNFAPGEKEFTANRFDRNKQDVKTLSFNVRGADTVSIMSTGSIKVLYERKTGALTIYGGVDRVVTDSGERFISSGKREIELKTTSPGAFYGAGERGHSLNLRGDTLVMYNRPTYGYTGGDSRINQMNITMPLFISANGFAIVFDDFAAAEMILGDPIKYISESPGAISYYYVNGVSTVADVVEQLSAITGRQDLPPLWSLGYITSKYGYRTQKETVDVVNRLKREGYPLDGVVLDLYWYGNEEDMGRLDWEPKQWPDPRKMLAALDRKGVKVVPISQPYVLRNGKGVENYDSLAPKGVFVMDSLGNPLEVEIWVGKGGMFDVSNPATRDWLAKRYAELTDMGVGGWWGDLGEPEKHPDEARHANGLKAREYHNRYGNDWSSIIYEMFREKYPDTRLFALMRGGTTGLQQYSVFPWSGDVSRSWGGLEPQIRIMLNSGLSGLGYMSHDVGGFAIDKENPKDPELYVRWLQLGLFSPVLRTHSSEFAEPYNYPGQVDIVKSLIRERYSWLPYNYTLAYENATKGWPLVRPLNFHGEGPDGCDTIYDEYLWGRDVLVAPVLTQGATARSIVFPRGRWIDVNHPRVSYTRAVNNYEAPLSVLPLFVRAGAFIPKAEYSMDNTAGYDPSKLSIYYYPYAGVKSEYTLFDDDRMSPVSLKNGQYRLVRFSGDCAENGDISIGVNSEGSYVGASEYITFDFVLPGLERGPQQVVLNGKNIKFKYDKSTGKLSFKIKFKAGQQSEIKINF